MKRAFVLTSVALLVSGLAALAGCEQKSQTSVPAPAPSADKPAPAAGPHDSAAPASAPAVTASDLEQAGEALKKRIEPQAPALPPGHPPLDAKSPAAAPPPAQAQLPPGHPPMGDSGKVLQYEVPEAWKAETPASRMRKAQFALPAEGEQKAELIVYYFGKGQGGPIADNLSRWKQMFVDDEGKPVGEDAVRQEKFKANGLDVTVLDVTGVYQASMMPGVTPATATHGNYRMLAAIVETPDGPWFFKAVGPADAIGAQRENFMKFMHSVKY